MPGASSTSFPNPTSGRFHFCLPVIAKLLDGRRLVLEATAEGYRIHGLATLNKPCVLKSTSP